MGVVTSRSGQDEYQRMQKGYQWQAFCILFRRYIAAIRLLVHSFCNFLNIIGC